MRSLFSTLARRRLQQKGVSTLPGTSHVRNRRATCWWEPFYDPSCEVSSQAWAWDIQADSGPVKRLVTGRKLSEVVSTGETYKVVGKTFSCCDFQGKFDPGSIILFDNCKFERCDFAFSSWRDSNFRNCKFVECSFALSSFERSEFRDNTWEKIGFSGSKTDLNRCFITNPDELISAGYSGCNPEDTSFKHKMYQWHRLEGTKAHFLRSIVLSHQETGSDKSFYLAVKYHDKASVQSEIYKSLYDLIFLHNRFKSIFKLLFSVIEFVSLWIFGQINNWGGSASRPLILLILNTYLFKLIYDFYNVGNLSFQKSFNITILAGYSNEYQFGMSDRLIFIQNIQIIISIIIYTVFFSTVVSKLSRAR